MLEKGKKGLRNHMHGRAGTKRLPVAQIDEAIDFTHVYDLVEDLYCKDNGRSRGANTILVFAVPSYYVLSLAGVFKYKENHSFRCGFLRLFGMKLVFRDGAYISIAYCEY